METCILNTPLGSLSIVGDALGIASVVFLDESQTETPENTVPSELRDAYGQLSEFFSRKREIFDLKLNPQGTDFQKRVWQQLATIPHGKTTNYLTIAKQLGDPKVIRAAASANGKNPIAILIPCHRVIGSDGSLTGYAGGLWRKQWLLEHEGAVVQTTLF